MILVIIGRLVSLRHATHPIGIHVAQRQCVQEVVSRELQLQPVHEGHRTHHFVGVTPTFLQAHERSAPPILLAYELIGLKS